MANVSTDPSLPQLALLVELVELENPSLIAARKYFINKVCFGRIRVSSLIATFLRMLAFTLIKDTAPNETAAIGLDLGDPVDGLVVMSLESWRTATIRIACDAGALDGAVDFAKEILAWMQEYQEVERSMGDTRAKYDELEHKIVDRCIDRILARIGKITSTETGPSPFLKIKNIIKKIVGTVMPASVPFQPDFNNFIVEGLPTTAKYTSSNYVQTNSVTFDVLEVYLGLVDALPDIYEEQYYEHVIHAIFVAGRISENRVSVYILATACMLVGEDPDEFINYFNNLGEYHKAASTFHRVAVYNSGGKSLLSRFDVKIVPLDLEPVRHSILDSSTSVNHFHELKTRLLLPGQLCQSHGTAATQLESEYNHRYQNLCPEEHCEMRLMRFYEESKGANIIPLDYFGLSEPSCFSCDFVLKNLGIGHPKRGPFQAKYIVSGTSGKVDATWKFPGIHYTNPAYTDRIRSIEASLLERLWWPAGNMLLEMLYAE